MTAKLKQNFLIAVSVLLAGCSIGFSFGGSTFMWFWQRYPVIPVLLLVMVFFAVRCWLKLEVERQRQIIHEEYLKSIEIKGHKNITGLLSSRETEVFRLINEGLGNKEIAAKLFISLSTVKTHINNIYRILEVKNRRDAIDKMSAG